MSREPAPLDSPTETVASLRDLYRASEARAARLRLLIEAGRDLAAAKRDNLDEILSHSARRAAHFYGFHTGAVTDATDINGIALIAPGPEGRRVGTLLLEGGALPSISGDDEDGEAFRLLAQLFAAAIERVAREEERERLLGELKERERRLELVVERLFSAQEDERRRVSGGLHDGVAQTAGALFRRLESRNASSDGATTDDAELAQIAQGLVRELRRVIAGLRPTALDDLGLAAALSGLADALRADGYEVDFNAPGQQVWPPVLATAFFRVGQEALVNIAKHAGGPCRVEIDLASDAKAGAWKLRVRDFGKGFGAARPQDAQSGEHVGIEVMQERMMAIRGVLDVSEHAGGGVVVTAAVNEAAQS
ncbi:MAG: histidine kinase [Hyphomonas sp.]|nr:histidine kinase [Hyphomonas sp.]